MSLLLDKLAAANPRARHPFAAFGEPIVCRGCDCDDDHACVDAAGNVCSWFSIEVALPAGVCSFCATANGLDRPFVCDVPIEKAA